MYSITCAVDRAIGESRRHRFSGNIFVYRYMFDHARYDSATGRIQNVDSGLIFII